MKLTRALFLALWCPLLSGASSSELALAQTGGASNPRCILDCTDNLLADWHYCRALPCGDMLASERADICWLDYRECRSACEKQPQPLECRYECETNISNCQEELKYDCPHYAEWIDKLIEAHEACEKECLKEPPAAPDGEDSELLLTQ